MGAAAPKPPLAIHPHSKLRGILAFSNKARQNAKNTEHFKRIYRVASLPPKFAGLRF